MIIINTMKKRQIKEFEIELFEKNIDNYEEKIDEVYFNKILNFLDKNQKYGVVLEAGCGTGSYGLKFMEYLNFEYLFGVDISKKMIEKFNSKNVKNTKGIAGDIEEEELFTNEKFDTIIFHNILHHFPDLNQVIKSSNKWLKKKGKIIMIEPNGDSLPLIISSSIRKIMTLFMGKNYLIKNQIATPNEINHKYSNYKNIFFKHDFKIIKIKIIENITKNKLYNFKENKLFSLTIFTYGFLWRLFYKLLCLFLPNKYTHNIIMMELNKI